MLVDFARLYSIARMQGNEDAADRIRDVLLWLLSTPIGARGD